MRMTVTALTLLAGIATMPAFAQDAPRDEKPVAAVETPRVDKPVIATVPADEYKAPALDLSALPKADPAQDAAPKAPPTKTASAIEDMPSQLPAVRPAKRREATALPPSEPKCRSNFLPIVGGYPGGTPECD